MNLMNFTSAPEVCIAAARGFARQRGNSTKQIDFPTWKFIEFTKFTGSLTLGKPGFKAKKGGCGGPAGEFSSFFDRRPPRRPLFPLLMSELYVLWLTLKSVRPLFALQPKKVMNFPVNFDELLFWKFTRKQALGFFNISRREYDRDAVV